jgi:hypothetical protein
LVAGNASHVDPRRSTHGPKLRREFATVLELFLVGVITKLKDRCFDLAAPVE